jgi:hypothetical protein
MRSRRLSQPILLLSLLAALGGCSQLSAEDRALQMFVEGDRANAEYIAAAAGLSHYYVCMQLLRPVAMASPAPENDGLLVLGARVAALDQALHGDCGSVVAPILLKALGKATAPFSIALPF